MSYQAFYRTYRPQKFSEVVGQKAAIKTLENALRENKIGHAYLFCGPRGTGKTTMARLFAKALNCEEGLGHECDHCPNCEAIRNGSHPDVFEIDAASNSGVENVRNLIDQVRYQPILGKYKIYIIDEVHNMTSGAFNALLKTLEEPPSNVVFILATTEPQKVLPTILSRVQRFDFTKVSDLDIISKMNEILSEEKVEHDDESLRLIARLADGGVRDALSILEQVVSYSGNSITVDDVDTLFGLLNVEEKLALVKKLGNRDLPEVLTQTKELYARGIDIVRLHDDLIKIYKDLLVFGLTKEDSLLTVLEPEEALKTLIKPSIIRQSLQILTDTRREYRRVNNAFDHFELAMIQVCSLSDNPTKTVEPAPAVQQRVEKPVERTVTKPIEQQPEVISEPIYEEEVVNKPVEQVKPTTKPVVRVTGDSFNTGPGLDMRDEDVVQIMVQGSKTEKQNLLNKWAKLSDQAVIAGYELFGVMLNSATPRIIGANVLVVETMFPVQANKMNLIGNQEGLRKTLVDLFGITTYVFALSHEDYLRLVGKYKNLQQAGKLPEAQPLDFERILRKDANDKFIKEIKEGE